MSTCWVPVVTAKLVHYFISVVQEQNLINCFTFISMLPFFIREMRKRHCNVYHKLGNYFYIVQLVGYLQGSVDVYIGGKKLQANLVLVKGAGLIAEKGDLPPGTTDSDWTLCMCVWTVNI